jgi:outer membrane protein TolC
MVGLGLCLAWPAGAHPAGGAGVPPPDAAAEASGEGAELLVPPLTEGEMGVEEGWRKVPLTLLDAVRLGLERNVELRKGLLDRATQRLDLSLAERLFEPEFYVQGRYQYEAGSERDTRGLGVEVRKRLRTNGELTLQWDVDNILERRDSRDYNRSAVGLSLRQPLLRGAGITVGTAPVVTARYTERRNVLAFHSLLMSRITAIQVAYWDLLLAMENRLSTIRSLEASKDVLERNRQLIRAGRKAAADLVSAQQEVARNRVSVLDQEFAVQAANRRLVNLLDLDNNVAILPVEGFVYREVRVDANRMMEAALHLNPRLRSAAVNLRQRELNLKLARAFSRDQLGLDVAASRAVRDQSLGAAVGESGDLGEDWTASLSFTIPLGLPRDRLQRDVTVAARELAKAKLDLKQQRLAVLQEVRNSVNDVNRSLRQIKLAQTSRELAQRKYEIERVRLELGRTTNFQVLSYQRDLTNARDQEHQAVATYLKSLARLDEAVGQALQTWHVKVQTPEAPKIPSLRLDKLAVPPGLPVTD